VGVSLTPALRGGKEKKESEGGGEREIK